MKSRSMKNKKWNLKLKFFLFCIYNFIKFKNENFIKIKNKKKIKKNKLINF